MKFLSINCLNCLTSEIDRNPRLAKSLSENDLKKKIFLFLFFYLLLWRYNTHELHELCRNSNNFNTTVVYVLTFYVNVSEAFYVTLCYNNKRIFFFCLTFLYFGASEFRLNVFFSAVCNIHVSFTRVLLYAKGKMIFLCSSYRKNIFIK